MELFEVKMPIPVEEITEAQTETIRLIEEGQFSEAKAILISPSKLTKTISAFANSDGGDLYVGISEETQPQNVRTWAGFTNQEAANAHLQVFEGLFPLGTDFSYAFLKCSSRPGLVLHVHINRTKGIVWASNSISYIRRGAQNLPQDTPELIKRLEYAKGVTEVAPEI
jgi:ATP-dependent DNA helicase RecG